MKKTFSILFILLCFCSCKKFSPREFAGRYQLDHPVLKTEVPYDFEPVLTINSDNTFELKKDISINGHWEFIEYEGEHAVIVFEFNEKHISARFEGNIIYFENPNDFDNGAFQSMLYVKVGD